jgi:hypothetical protein
MMFCRVYDEINLPIYFPVLKLLGNRHVEVIRQSNDLLRRVPMVRAAALAGREETVLVYVGDAVPWHVRQFGNRVQFEFHCVHCSSVGEQGPSHLS